MNNALGSKHRQSMLLNVITENVNILLVSQRYKYKRSRLYVLFKEMFCVMTCDLNDSLSLHFDSSSKISKVCLQIFSRHFRVFPFDPFWQYSRAKIKLISVQIIISENLLATFCNQKLSFLIWVVFLLVF
jgi:hypothetical protein